METASCHLPPEILLKIFSFLTPDELRCLVAPVSEYWGRLAYDPTLWKEIRHEGLTPFPDHTRKLFENSHLIQKLEFANVRSWNLADSLPRWNCLRTIRFEQTCNISSSDMRSLVKNSPFVENVRLETKYIDEELVQEIVRWQFLKDVIMLPARRRCFGNACLEIIASDCKHLERIKFNVPVDEKSFIYCTELRASNIKLLDLNVKFETMRGIESLGQYVNLTKLRLQLDSRMSNFKMLVLKKLTLLRKLTICDATNSEIFVDIFKRTTFNNLTALKLSLCRDVGDLCLTYIAESCPLLKSLTIFGGKKITEDGLRAICEHCRYLESLTIIISDVTCETIAGNLQSLPNLRFLYLSGCRKVTDETISQIKAQRSGPGLMSQFRSMKL